MSSNNDVVVVTGGASGIGLALAQGLLDTGRKVLALDLLEDRVAQARESLRTQRA
ncbi:MAG TPA: SDR family NAD(P)-dependent oxidoreductase, partial [Burkholderiaceae bacterium]|nr:SDR family NAD(P)-dependent oxidoreductase [Burkholderiaceae bacterium]